MVTGTLKNPFLEYFCMSEALEALRYSRILAVFFDGAFEGQNPNPQYLLDQKAIPESCVPHFKKVVGACVRASRAISYIRSQYGVDSVGRFPDPSALSQKWFPNLKVEQGLQAVSDTYFVRFEGSKEWIQTGPGDKSNRIGFAYNRKNVNGQLLPIGKIEERSPKALRSLGYAVCPISRESTIAHERRHMIGSLLQDVGKYEFTETVARLYENSICWREELANDRDRICEIIRRRQLYCSDQKIQCSKLNLEMYRWRELNLSSQDVVKGIGFNLPKYEQDHKKLLERKNFLNQCTLSLETVLTSNVEVLLHKGVSPKVVSYLLSVVPLSQLGPVLLELEERTDLTDRDLF
jgi:hypothetical protein